MPGAIRIVAVPIRIDCTASSSVAKPWPVSCDGERRGAGCAASGGGGEQRQQGESGHGAWERLLFRAWLSALLYD